jgi:hypothetical protein
MGATGRTDVSRHVYLAVGHGRRPDGTMDSGAVSKDGRKSEQSEGAIIVGHLARYLRSAGVRVTAQSQGDPNFAGRSGYTQTANRLGVDLALTIHHDWHQAPRGFFCHWAGGAGTTVERAGREATNRRAADALYAAVKDAGFPMRPSWHKRRTDLTFTTRTTVPAVLVECDRIGEVTDHCGLAEAIGRGVLDFLGLPPTEDDEMTPEQEAKLDRALALLERLPTEMWTLRFGPENHTAQRWLANAGRDAEALRKAQGLSR